MTYLFSSEAQIRIFLYAIGFGFFLGAVYDLFRMFRLLFQKTDRAYRVSDLLFALTAGLLVFLFVLTTLNGQIRGYVLCGILFGFLLYAYTFGTFFAGRMEHAASAIRRFLSAIYRKISAPFLRFVKKYRAKFAKNVQKAQKKSKFSVKKSKFHLKSVKEMLYNQPVKVSSDGGSSRNDERNGKENESKKEKTPKT
ncbi:MAG: spore cortex biosynthesis protein YabQ [Candidatus Fimenecus sp.]